MPKRLVALAFLGFLVGLAHADTRIQVDDLPVSLRRLCIDAPTVVLAMPVDPITPTRFFVSRSLRGPLRVGEPIEPVGIEPTLVRTFDEPDLAEKKPRPRRYTSALLFLEPGPKGKGWQVMPWGMRFCTEDGKFLAPINRRGALAVQEKIRWAIVTRTVQQDLAAIEQLQGFRRIGRPSRRAQALLGWVQARKADFTATPPGSDEAPTGWDHLQQDIFDWIFAAVGPEDAWQAVRLYAELNHGETPRLLTPAFATREGRALLARLAGDAKLLLGDRTRALHLLGSRATLWPEAADRKRGAKSLDPEERVKLSETLTALLTEKNDAFRAAVTIALVQLTQTPRSPLLAKSLPMLIQTYRESQPGPARDELAFALAALAPGEKWKELSGNPAGFCVCLREFDRRERTVTFWMTLRTPGLWVHEQPTLVVERLGTLGFVAETKRFPLEARNLDGSWSAGWKGEDSLVVQFDTGGLQPGHNYRVRVEGVAGRSKDRQKWTSEPRKFYLPGPRPDNESSGRYRR